jgi:hypothetical protein
LNSHMKYIFNIWRFFLPKIYKAWSVYVVTFQDTVTIKNMFAVLVYVNSAL